MKQNQVKVPLSLFFFVTILYSCTYDDKDEFYMEETICDTIDISYSTHIDPIIKVSCLSCHNGPQGNGGVDLSTYEKVKESANLGELLGVIRHDEGYPPMPQFLPKLDDCKIRQVEKWIEDGTLNN